LSELCRTRQRIAAAVILELDYPDVSANFAVMAALDPRIKSEDMGGHPEKHKVLQVMTGWPGQARP